MENHIRIELTTRNAAFTGNQAGETARILRGLADRIESGGEAISPGPLLDYNGNKVGGVTVLTVHDLDDDDDEPEPLGDWRDDDYAQHYGVED